MPQFTETDDKTAITALTLAPGSHRRVRFLEEQKATTATVKSSAPTSVKVGHSTLFDGPHGIWTVDLTAVAKGAATVEGKRKDGGAATIAVTVTDPLPPMTLPADNTESGMVARLLLAEVMTPEYFAYDPAVAKTEMQWMVVVLHNRLSSPERFRARGATTIAQIIKAEGQFAGFTDYPRMSARVQSRIHAVLDVAKKLDASLRDEYRAHVQAAIDVASAPPIQDPSPNGLIGWKTAGATSPSAEFADFGVPKLGNQFYQWKSKP
ncbi:MAG: hypothetical protein ABSH49_23525 [Bryobacteraceae bacterium]|jgi:hypothetical protein